MDRVYMIRHGKPKSTWGDDPSADPGLDDIGFAQAEAAARALMALPEAFRPISVISSPLARCRETAMPFAQALGVELEIDPIYGEVPTPKNLPAEERPSWLRRAFAGRWDEIVGDLDYDGWRRAIASGLLTRPRTAVFSHYVAINGAVSAVTGNPNVLAFRPDHASITTFGLDGGRVSLIELGREAVTGVL